MHVRSRNTLLCVLLAGAHSYVLNVAIRQPTGSCRIRLTVSAQGDSMVKEGSVNAADAMVLEELKHEMLMRVEEHKAPHFEKHEASRGLTLPEPIDLMAAAVIAGEELVRQVRKANGEEPATDDRDAMTIVGEAAVETTAKVASAAVALNVAANFILAAPKAAVSAWAVVKAGAAVTSEPPLPSAHHCSSSVRVAEEEA